MVSVTKNEAIALLGGTPTEAARTIGITPQAVSQWPDQLPRILEDRVVAALARRHPDFAAYAQPREAA